MLKQTSRQTQRIYGYPDGYPNEVYFIQGEDEKWSWVIVHQKRPMVRGVRKYASKASAKRGFLSHLTHSFQMRN